jgi:hypothetical protein
MTSAVPGKSLVVPSGRVLVNKDFATFFRNTAMTFSF